MVHKGERQWMTYTVDEKVEHNPATERPHVYDGDFMFVIGVDMSSNRLLVMCKRGIGWIHPYMNDPV